MIGLLLPSCPRKPVNKANFYPPSTLPPLVFVYIHKQTLHVWRGDVCAYTDPFVTIHAAEIHCHPTIINLCHFGKLFTISKSEIDQDH